MTQQPKSRTSLGAALAGGNPERARAGTRVGGIEDERKSVAMQMPISLWVRWKKQAAEERTTIQAITQRAIESYLDQHEHEN